MKKILIPLLIFLILLIFFPIINSFGDLTIPDENEKYIVNLTTSPEIPVIGRETEISLELIDKETNYTISNFESWVRLTSNGETLFVADSLKPEYGKISFMYNFQKTGTYILSTTFKHNGENINSHIEVPIKTPALASQNLAFAIIFLIGAIFGVLLSMRVRNIIKF
jgi:hypothetical protein